MHSVAAKLYESSGNGQIRVMLDGRASQPTRQLQTTNKLNFPTPPTDQVDSAGQSATFSVGAAGEGPFTYQWQFAGVDISSATDSTYSKSNLHVSDAGVYSVSVTGSNGTGCNATNSATLTVSPPTVIATVSNNKITLTWQSDYSLQSAPTVVGPWTDVGSPSGYQEDLNSSTAKFFRLHQ